MHSIYSMFLCHYSTNASLVSNAMKVLHISSTSPGKGMLHTIEVGCASSGVLITRVTLDPST